MLFKHQFKVDEFFTNHLKLAKIGAVREFQNYGKNVDPIEYISNLSFIILNKVLIFACYI